MINEKHRLNFFLFILLILVSSAALCIGRYTMNPLDVLRSAFNYGNNPALDTVIWTVRMPRIIMAAVVGAGLSAAGLSLQAMFGNPLVSAHVLGVSYSAGFGAAFGILLFSNFVLVETSSLLFGLFGMALTYRLSKRKGQRSTLTLVLAGIIVGAAFEALTSLVKFIADPESKLPTITYWLMGSLAGVSYDDIIKAVPFLFAAVFLLWLLRWRLNVLSLSREEALSLGVNLNSTRALIIAATALIAALTVSHCGVIGFVGLAVPHLSRMIIGTDHKYNCLTSILLGAVFLIVIDTLARSITPTEIPLSILTALVGAPIFATLLNKSGGGWYD